MEVTESKRKYLRNHFFQRLFFRLFMCFALVACMFAITLSVIYSRLYEESTIHSYRDDLATKAQLISEKISNLAFSNDAQGFRAYSDTVQSMFDQKQTDIYIISNTESPFALD